MANTLTNLIPSLYEGLDTVSRELAGYIAAVRRNTSADRAALNQTVTFPVTPAGNVTNIAPAMTVPEPTDQTVGTDTISITKSRAAEFGFAGEEVLGLNNNGLGFSPVQADMFAQGVRALVNEVETDLAAAAAVGASSAYGSIGVLPFATNIDALNQLGKILSDHGAPTSDRQFVGDTTTGAALRTLYGINTDRDWSQAPFQQQGVLITPHGMQVRETGQSVSHTGGTGDSATTNDDGYAVGATTITLASAGTGSILDGDVITFAGDANKYVVETGDANVAGGGTVVIQEPGLKVAIPGSNTAITVLGNDESPANPDYDVAGVAFYRNAIVLAARAPALPEEGDMAADRMMLTDPRSGLAFEVAAYKGYRKTRYEVALAWGVKVAQPRHTALLLR
jgi:hypothetical protein